MPARVMSRERLSTGAHGSDIWGDLKKVVVFYVY
jgi:hypothetical protein